MFLTASEKLTSISIVHVRHTHSPYAQLQTTDVLRRAVGESDNCTRMPNGALSFPSTTQAHQLDATLREEYETDLIEVNIKPEKCTLSVYGALHKILMARWWAVNSSAT